MAIVYPKQHHRSFSSRSGTHFITSRLIGPTIVTERASDNQRLRSLDYTTLVAKLPRVRN